MYNGGMKRKTTKFYTISNVIIRGFNETRRDKYQFRRKFDMKVSIIELKDGSTRDSFRNELF